MTTEPSSVDLHSHCFDSRRAGRRPGSEEWSAGPTAGEAPAGQGEAQAGDGEP